MLFSPIDEIEHFILKQSPRAIYHRTDPAFMNPSRRRHTLERAVPAKISVNGNVNLLSARRN